MLFFLCSSLCALVIFSCYEPLSPLSSWFYDGTTVNNVLSGIQYINMKKKLICNQSHSGVVVSKSAS